MTIEEDIKTILEKFDDIKEGTIKKLTKKLSEYVADQKELAKRKLKDPNAPKKPKSAYMIYCGENRQKVVQELQETTDDKKQIQKQAMVNLGTGWQNLTDKEKEKYKKKALKDKQRYTEEMKDYTPPSDEELAELDINKKKRRKKGGSSKKAKDPNAPKNVRSAYILFSMEERAKMTKSGQHKKGAEMTKKIGSKWKSLSSDEKEKWNKKAAEDKKRFKEEMEKYKGTQEDQDEKPQAKSPKKGKNVKATGKTTSKTPSKTPSKTAPAKKDAKKNSKKNKKDEDEEEPVKNEDDDELEDSSDEE